MVQIAVAWSLKRVTAPIVGTTKLENLKEMIGKRDAACCYPRGTDQNCRGSRCRTDGGGQASGRTIIALQILDMSGVMENVGLGSVQTCRVIPSAFSPSDRPLLEENGVHPRAITPSSISSTSFTLLIVCWDADRQHNDSGVIGIGFRIVILE